MRRYQLSVYKYPVRGTWVVITDKELQELERTDKAAYEEWDNFIYESQLCPIRNFLPHGVPRGGTGWPNDGLACVNDWKNDILLLLAANQVGKSVHGMAFTSFHGLFPTDKTWPCFTEHKIEWHEWTGPKIAIVASWSWDNTINLWRAYQEWLPREELGKYAPGYGRFEGEKGRAIEMSFGSNATKEITLKCGTRIIFLCYTQQQIHWEGKQCDLAHLDEQIPEDKMDGLMARTLTRGPYTPFIMTLTGHVLPGRPDTGAAGWIKTKLIDQKSTKGKKFAEYHISIKSTPDAIMAPENKEAARIQWVVEPERNHDVQKINEGIARYWGGWQIGGGLAINEFNTSIHVIKKFDLFQHKPTWYRMIDHGQNPCAALLFARLPWGDIIVAAEHYLHGFKSIDENARQIVEKMTENEIHKVDEYEEAGQRICVYQEKFVKRVLAASELDSRSYAGKAVESRRSNGRTLGGLYNQFGCSCKPAVGTRDGILIPLVKELFVLDRKKKHINARLGRRVESLQSKYGAPSIYIFSECENLIMELGQFIVDPKTGKYSGKNHLIDCLKYYTGRERPYMGELWEMYKEPDQEQIEEQNNRKTNWRI